MLETAETRPAISVEQYETLEPELRTQLVAMQQQMRNAKFALIIIVSGDDAAGVRAVTNLFSEWMDPRFVATSVFGEPTGDELLRPPSWRYWRELPPNGRTAVFSDEWTTRALALRIGGKMGQRRYEDSIENCRQFETMLAADGTVFVKLYVHLADKDLAKQRKRLRKESGWSSVASIGRAMLKHPVKARKLVEEMLEHTSTGLSAWKLVEGTCKRSRNVVAARAVLDAVNVKLNQKEAVSAGTTATAAAVEAPEKSILSSVDLSSKLDPDEYEDRMADLKTELSRVALKAQRKGIPVIAAFEGWDAAGKGGVIRRLAQSMNPEQYRIVPIAAPTDEEKSHHYLWRFWRHIPANGNFVIFDRTWYGRVLVERVEGFAKPDEWGRAYSEINFFEDHLVRQGAVMLKFWLHIDQEEQLRRFKDRENTPFKSYKIGPEDYRNREKWDQYVAAIDDMVARTSTPDAPWHLIPSNDKMFARVDVISRVIKAIKDRI